MLRAGAAQSRLPLSAGMITRKFPRRHQHRHQRPSRLRQPILDTRRLLAEILPFDEPVQLQLPQVLCEHLLRNARHVALQLQSAHRGFGEQAKQDRQLPAPADHLQHPRHMRDGAIRAEADGAVLLFYRHF